MTQKKYFKLVATILLVFSIPLASFPTTGQGGRQRAQPSANDRPKLVVLIVIDQFRYDYLERFEDLFGPGGFKRLINNGAFFTNANYDYVPPYTACGHPAIA